MIFKSHKIFFIAALFSCLLLPISSLWAGSEGPPPGHDDTMLMFVGEDLEVLSIASRRQESAWQAPAVAQVVTRKELEERGIKTLSHALEMIPGFYMARKEWGTQPYLRGIPDSFLFLYDTVPLGSDISKSLHPLDHELSLAPVKRIEIIRGPGSVLWGPDAFAGIVNVVPMTGKDLDGVETGILYGSPGDQEAFYVNMGHNAGLWDVFLSVSGREGKEDDTVSNLVRFWGDGETPVAPEDRFGEEKPGGSRYLEASGCFSFRDWFTVSGLLSDYKRPYAMTEKDLTWRESRSAPFGFIKLEAKKDLNRSSALRFTGSYSWLNPEYEIIDLTLKQKERTSYGEIIYDRSFLSGRGLFTAGLSYRERHIEDAPIWDGYLPEYLGPENESFLPIITEADYDTRLRSLFGQYTHKIGDLDLWLGVRNDEHDDYKNHVSYNAGAVWSASSQWVFKLLYGTAYRTPFASQLLEEEETDLEKIKTLNLQVAWKPVKQAGLSVCGFISRIENHIMEDPYAGLSQPNNQDIKGVEIEGRLSPAKGLNFSANLTLIDNSGPDEIYHNKTYFDGTIWHYEDLSYPYDSGPRTLFNLTGTWRPSEKVTTFARLGYFSSRRLIYPRATEFHSTPGVWLLDLTASIRDVVFSGLELEFSIRNLTDKEYDTPGTYSTIEGEPFSATVMLRKRW
jgi:outer membrane cobalamin receptor